MGCDFSSIVAGQQVTITITVHGPVAAAAGETFSEEANLAIKHLRDLNVNIDVQQDGTQRVVVSAESSSPQQAEALALKVRQLLTQAGYDNPVLVRRTPARAKRPDAAAPKRPGRRRK